jgi:predicted amidophosphoribosyltransferase
MLTTKQNPEHHAESYSWMIFYFPSNRGYRDHASGLLLDFKSNSKPYVSAWTDSIIKEIDNLPDIDIVVRVLGSEELTASGDEPLDILGKEIAKAKGGKYCSKCLTKKRHHQPLKSMQKYQRQSEIKDLYEFSIEKSSDVIRLLIIDDVMTTSTSLMEICNEIRKKYSKKEIIIHLFSIARTASLNDEDLQSESEHNQKFIDKHKFPSLIDLLDF